MEKMGKMNLGNTLEEKRETYGVLSKKSKKWGKVFAILGIVCGIFFGGMLLGGSESKIVGVLIFSLLTVAAPICYYWYGKVLYYGYLAVKLFFYERNIGVDAVAGAVGTSVLVSYALGGKGAVKKLGIAWLVVLFIVVSVGIFAGLYYFIKIQKEVKELGFISRSELKSQNA